LDRDDWPPFRQEFGVANRGFYVPLKEKTLAWPVWPDYLTNRIFVDDETSHWFNRIFDHVVYLYGSSCANDVGLAMTLAHELQHFIQHNNVRTLWAVNTLIPGLPKSVINDLELKWSDIPIEWEARIVSKRTAEDLYGKESVGQYIDGRISSAISEDDVADWRFVRELTTSTPFNLKTETQAIFRRLRNHKTEFEKLLQEMKDEHDPDFEDINLFTVLEGVPW
jgi:hypothetical protein